MPWRTSRDGQLVSYSPLPCHTPSPATPPPPTTYCRTGFECERLIIANCEFVSRSQLLDRNNKVTQNPFVAVVATNNAFKAQCAGSALTSHFRTPRGAIYASSATTHVILMGVASMSA